MVQHQPRNMSLMPNNYVDEGDEHAQARGQDGTTTVKSEGSGINFQSQIHLSAESPAFTTSEQQDNISRDYLGERTYNYFQARSAWIRRAKEERDGYDSEEAALERLPVDFEPFFTRDTRKQPTGSEDISATKYGDDLSNVTGEEGGTTRWSFELVYHVFSSRAWDKLYLLLGLSWSILNPAYMDGVLPVGPYMASLLFIMSISAATPAVLAVILKTYYFGKLRARLENNQHWAGVFFVLATKSLPVPAACARWWQPKHRVHATERAAKIWEEQEVQAGNLERGEVGTAKDDGARWERSQDKSRKVAYYEEAEHRRVEDISASHGDGGQFEGQGGGGEISVLSLDPNHTTDVELPPRHWMCTACKKVNTFPSKWNGRAGKLMQIVMKRKKIDKQIMFAVFNTRPSFPLCTKCQTPFNYTWRNSRTVIATLRQISELGGRKSCIATGFISGAAPKMAIEGAGVTEPYKTFKCLLNSVHHIVASTSNPTTGRIDPAGAPELWYVRGFRRQLDTYIKPQLERPSLSAQGGRYPSGARVECFEGKGVWCPGIVTVSHENETYDVRFDDGDIAQHVFPHMVRFQPIHTDSSLVCCFYGLTLAAGVIWPLMGFVYLSGVSSKKRGALVAMPALFLGAIGVFAVVIQFLAIFRENRSAGPWTPAWYAAVVAVPWASLVLVGGLSVAKASSMSPSSPGSWLEVLFLPAVFFSLTGGGYVHALSPAYGKAWAVASLPWLLFLLLVTLRLDGEAGDANPMFGRMKWLAVFFPLWVLLLLLIAGHQVLPYVWDVHVFPEKDRGDDPGRNEQL